MLLPATWLAVVCFWLDRIIKFPTARYFFKLTREATKFFLCERLKAASDRLAAAGRKSTKIRRVHLPKPAQRAKPISVPKCAVGDNGNGCRSGSQAVERTQPSGSGWPTHCLRMASIQQKHTRASGTPQLPGSSAPLDLIWIKGPLPTRASFISCNERANMLRAETV